MRWLLTLLAMLALAASPVTATAAQQACDQVAPMAAMEMPGVDHAGIADPCCDPGGHQKHGGKTCAQACVACCVTVAALPVSSTGISRTFAPALMTPPPIVSARSHLPAGPEHPPKSTT